MKRNNYLVLLITIALLSSCKKEHLSQSQNQERKSWSSFSQVEVLDIIKDLGYTPDQVEETGEYFIVDRDILFAKKKKSNVQPKLLATTDLVTYSQQQNITIKIDNSIPSSILSNWREAIEDAVDNWNNISNCRLDFDIITSGTPDILIKSDDDILQDDYLLCGCPNDKPVAIASSYPYNGNVGDEILVNINVDDNAFGPLTLAQKVYNITHAIGHTVGFEHQATGGTYTWLIPGTTDYDANSFMKNNHFDNSMTFSSEDIIGIQYLYGVGIRVGFKSSNGKYLQAYNNGGGAVNCQGSYLGQWETFHLIPSPTYGTPYYNLRTISGKYVQATSGGGGALNANSSNGWDWETFELIPSSLYPGKFNLKLKGTNYYIQAASGGGSTANVASTNPWEWESFEMVYSYF